MQQATHGDTGITHESFHEDNSDNFSRVSFMARISYPISLFLYITSFYNN